MQPLPSLEHRPPRLSAAVDRPVAVLQVVDAGRRAGPFVALHGPAREDRRRVPGLLVLVAALARRLDEARHGAVDAERHHGDVRVSRVLLPRHEDAAPPRVLGEEVRLDPEGGREAVRVPRHVVVHRDAVELRVDPVGEELPGLPGARPARLVDELVEVRPVRVPDERVAAVGIEAPLIVGRQEVRAGPGRLLRRERDVAVVVGVLRPRGVRHLRVDHQREVAGGLPRSALAADDVVLDVVVVLPLIIEEVLLRRLAIDVEHLHVDEDLALRHDLAELVQDPSDRLDFVVPRRRERQLRRPIGQVGLVHPGEAEVLGVEVVDLRVRVEVRLEDVHLLPREDPARPAVVPEELVEVLPRRELSGAAAGDDRVGDPLRLSARDRGGLADLAKRAVRAAVRVEDAHEGVAVVHVGAQALLVEVEPREVPEERDEDLARREVDVDGAAADDGPVCVLRKVDAARADLLPRVDVGPHGQARADALVQGDGVDDLLVEPAVDGEEVLHLLELRRRQAQAVADLEEGAVGTVLEEPGAKAAPEAGDLAEVLEHRLQVRVAVHVDVELPREVADLDGVDVAVLRVRGGEDARHADELPLDVEHVSRVGAGVAIHVVHVGGVGRAVEGAALLLPAVPVDVLAGVGDAVLVHVLAVELVAEHCGGVADLLREAAHGDLDARGGEHLGADLVDVVARHVPLDAGDAGEGEGQEGQHPEDGDGEDEDDAPAALRGPERIALAHGALLSLETQ